MHNIIQDSSLLSTMPKTSIDSLFDKMSLALCHAFKEDISNGCDTMTYDIGIGKIHIAVDSSSIRYRFSPSKDLEQSLVSIVSGGRSPLEVRAEEILESKIRSTYKDLL